MFRDVGVIALLAFSMLTYQAYADTREPSPPVSCAGNQQVTLTGKRIDSEETAVVVSGNCKAEIVDSTISSAGTAIHATGNGRVKISGSRIEGSTAAYATGNGRVEIEDSHVEGDVALSVTGNGKIHHARTKILGDFVSKGSGKIVERNDSAAAGPEHASQQATQGTGVTANVSVNAGGVEVQRSFDADGTEHVTVGAPGTSVIVDGDYVRIKTPGSQVEVDGDWRTAIRAGYDTVEVMRTLGVVEDGPALRIDMAGDVLFDFGSAEIRPDASHRLNMLAHLLREKSVGEIEVTGHTDAIGTKSYNQTLSEKRALAVMHWLNREGSIPVALMKGRGMGEDAPAAGNTLADGSDDPTGRALNRRVEIRFNQ